MKPLTTQEIYARVCRHRGLRAWYHKSSPGLSDALAAWRRGATAREAADLAQDLRRAGIHGATIAAICGEAPPLKPAPGWPPRPTRAELDADAAHIKQWGHV